MTTSNPKTLREICSKTVHSYKRPRIPTLTACSSIKLTPPASSRSTYFSDEEIHDVRTDYILFCVAHHGAELTVDDQDIYTKISHLLTVMTGLSLPPFVVQILKQSHEKQRGKQLFTLQCTLNDDILQPTEVLRRSQITSSRRDYAVQVGQVMSAVYKLFYDAVNMMPEEEVKESMIDFTVVWKKEQFLPVVPNGDGFSSNQNRIASRFPAGADVKSSQKWRSYTSPIEPSTKKASIDQSKIAAPVPIQKSFESIIPVPVEKVIEIRFTLDGLTTTGGGAKDAKHYLFPVMSGTSILQEPTVDMGERAVKGCGRAGSWRRLKRRLGQRMLQMLVRVRNSTTSAAPRTDAVHFQSTLATAKAEVIVSPEKVKPVLKKIEVKK